MGYTDQSIKIMETIKERYQKLAQFYDDMSGNFCFTRTQALINMLLILKWMEEFNDFVLIFRDGEYYLTDSYENN